MFPFIGGKQIFGYRIGTNKYFVARKITQQKKGAGFLERKNNINIYIGVFTG